MNTMENVKTIMPVENFTEISFQGVKSDGSEYFNQWGSQDIMTLINEEFDNIIGADPNYAFVNISNNPFGSSIIFENDGITPDHARMLRMREIGRSVSDGKKASFHGIGQLGALIGGRKTPTSSATLIFESIHAGSETIFTITANGSNYSFSGGIIGPHTTNLPDRVRKTYKDLCSIDKNTMTEIKLQIAIKIAPYSKVNPNFVCYLDGDKIEPIDLLYPDVKDERIKRYYKEWDINYNGETVTFITEGAFLHKYVKPDGFNVDKEAANDYDIYYNASPESYGIYLVLNDTMTITGGELSWQLTGTSKHQTKTMQRHIIRFKDNGQTKSAICCESPKKSRVGTKLDKITDNYNNHPFAEMANYISERSREWKKTNDAEEKAKNTNNENGTNSFDTALNKISSYVLQMLETLTTEEQAAISGKKLSTIITKSKNLVKNV